MLRHKQRGVKVLVTSDGESDQLQTFKVAHSPGGEASNEVSGCACGALLEPALPIMVSFRIEVAAVTAVPARFIASTANLICSAALDTFAA